MHTFTEWQLIRVAGDEPLSRRKASISRPNVRIPEVSVTGVAVAKIAANDVLLPGEVRHQHEPVPAGVFHAGDQPVILAPADRRPGANDSPLWEASPLLEAQTRERSHRQIRLILIEELGLMDG